MEREPARIVAEGYDRVAEAYAALESGAEWPRMRWLARVLDELKDGSRVLDLGCGSGIPAMREIARRHRAVGVDVSARQVELARRNVPDAELIHEDILAVDFAARSLDAVVAFYVFDHLPRERHAELLERIHGWLRPRGLLLFTVEVEDEPGVVGRWLGVDMFFSSFDETTTRRLVADTGFEIEAGEVETQDEGGRDVPYLWVLARAAERVS